MKRAALFTSFILLFCTASFAAPKNALTEYAFAQKCYHSLSQTTPRGWDRCLKQFQGVVNQFPQSEEAPKALFSVGRLSQEKYGLTHNVSDLQKAFDTYNVFLKTYSRHPLSDDALYRIALLRLDVQRDATKAQKALKALLERYPDGDMAKMAEAALQRVSGEPPAAASSAGTGPVISAKPHPEDLGDQETWPVEVENQSSNGELKKSEQSEREEEETDAAGGGQADSSVRTVVIDPGHGGDDPGAIGSKGLQEADVALQIARKIAFKLKNDLKLKTYLTRTNNRTVLLEERNHFANQKKGDLFLSIHANANDSPKVSGVQTYYLNNATNEAAKRLAIRENKALGKKVDLPQKILTTMLQNANTEESRDLAQAVQKSLVGQLRKKYLGVRDLKVGSALFYVLVGSKSPGILVETSFITNPREEKRLNDSAYQWALAEGVAKGVQRYIELRKKTPSSL